MIEEGILGIILRHSSPDGLILTPDEFRSLARETMKTKYSRLFAHEAVEPAIKEASKRPMGLLCIGKMTQGLLFVGEE